MGFNVQTKSVRTRESQCFVIRTVSIMSMDNIRRTYKFNTDRKQITQRVIVFHLFNGLHIVDRVRRSKTISN